MSTVEVLFKELSYTIVGAAMEVHRFLGPGFLEAVYSEALDWELGLRRIPFVRQAGIPVEYKRKCIGDGLLCLFLVDRANFLRMNKLIFACLLSIVGFTISAGAVLPHVAREPQKSEIQVTHQERSLQPGEAVLFT